VQEQYVTGGTAWFTLSLINAGLAQSKGRSGLNWWFASLFLGPVATLLIVAWPRAGEVPGPGRPPGTMDRQQAVIIAVGIVVVIALVSGLATFFGAGTQPVTLP